jgi:hypothetical protein
MLFGSEVATDLLALLVEEIAHALQEEHAENVFLVLGGVHVAAEVVAGLERELLKLAER